MSPWYFCEDHPEPQRVQWSAIEAKRRMIQARQKVLSAEIAQREAEIANLDREWEMTCDEADQLLEKRR